MAEKQSILGVCFYGIMKLRRGSQTPPTELYNQWLAVASVIQQINEIVNKQCVTCCTTFNTAGFKNFIMKGQGNAQLYGHDLCLLRQPGDIDIFLKGEYRHIMDYVKATYPAQKVDELEIQYPCFVDTIVEIHYHPFLFTNPLKNRILNVFWETQYDACFKKSVSLPENAGVITVPTLTFNIVHQMCHIHHHLFTEGVGLRQLMDYYFLLKSGMSIDVLSTIYKLGLKQFASALMWVLGEVFRLERNLMIVAPNEKDGRFLLHEIMKSGNFGKYDDRTSGIYDNKWKSFWLIHLKTFRMWRFDHWAWFWSPLWRIYHFGWRKIHGFK